MPKYKRFIVKTNMTLRPGRVLILETETEQNQADIKRWLEVGAIEEEQATPAAKKEAK